MKRDDYFLGDAGEFSRMFEITGVSSLGTSSAELRIRDGCSGDTSEGGLGADNATEKVIDGQSYFFNVSGGSSDPNIGVSWGGSANEEADTNDATLNADPGTYITVFPVLKTKLNDEGVALFEDVTIAGLDGGVAYLLDLPTGAVGVSVVGGANNASTATLTANTTEDSESTQTLTATLGTLTLTNVTGAVTRVGRTSSGGAFYMFNYTHTGGVGSLQIRMSSSAGVAITDPGVLLVEEEDDDGNVGSVLFEADWDDSNDETDVSSPTISYTASATSNSGTRESDTDVTRYVSRWGTWIERDSEDQARVMIKYPDEEVTAVVAVLGEGADVSLAGGVSGGSVKSAVPIKTSIAKLDREVTSSDRSNRNLILVGGPVVNSLVAELAAAGKTWTTDQYRSEGEGTAILNLVEDAFASGRSALVVAGHSAADSRLVAGVLQNFDGHASELDGRNLAVWKNGVISSSLSS
jgi:hypothetical protein